MVSGCSILPYETEFACEKNLNLGKCISVEEAYSEAVTGVETAPRINSEDNEDTEKKEVKAVLSEPPKKAAYESYQDVMFNELSGLIKQHDTPLVRPAKQYRTLILSYSVDEMLFMPRYVYGIEKKTEFVLGQYLLKSDPELASLESFMKRGE